MRNIHSRGKTHLVKSPARCCIGARARVLEARVWANCDHTTSEDHVRSTCRNFLPPAIRWQFSGIRLVK